MKKPYSVSEITGLIKQSLEGEYGDVSVEGELSNFRPSSAGHVYFNLKDTGAIISCVLFRYQIRGTLALSLKDGMFIRVHGRVSVYEARGNYQIICDSLEKQGEGEILAMLEARKRMLAAEGLFDEEHKKSLPRFPECVGVVSSPTGAALRDILNVLGRRAPGIRVVVLPALVQGAGAAEEIAARIRQANQWKLASTLIVGRGGGSLEDLLAFSDELVVRAVYESEIPVISAVGHEIDNAICDYAADLRAPTPSAAAELVSENWEETRYRVSSFTSLLYDTLEARIDRIRLLLEPFSSSNLTENFLKVVQPRMLKLDDAKELLVSSIASRTQSLSSRVKIARTIIEGANPLDILQRGYAIVRNKKTGVLVRAAKDAPGGTELQIRLHDGEVEAKVTA